MPILEKQSGSAFYKKGPLFQKTEEEAQAQAESQAQSNASENLKNSERVFGESTTTTERFKDERGRTGTKTTVTTPYTKSSEGKGSAKFNAAYRAAKASGKTSFPYGDKTIKVEAKEPASTSGKDSRSTIVYDKEKTLTLKPNPIKPFSAEPTANFQIDKTPQTPKGPKLEPIEGTSSTKVKVNKPKPRVNYKKAGSGGCSCS